MTQANFTDITILLDRSLSMKQIKEATIAGFNGFVEEQKLVPGDGCWSLVLFDDHDYALLNNEPFPLTAIHCQPQNSVPPLTAETFVPRGNTALIDAACITIDKIGQRLASTPEYLRPSKVLMVIITDGQENKSKDFTSSQLRERITHQREKYGWQFVFLGANQDAFVEAAKYGISKTCSSNFAFNDVGTRAVYRAASAGTRNWKLDGNESAKDFIIEPVRDESKLSVTVNVKK